LLREVEMSDSINVTIDGRVVEAKRGETILELAARHGIRIPTLCYHPRLPIVGACRVCVVEVEGARALVASCAFLVEQEGMVIKTDTERVKAARRLVVELLLASGDHNCLLCESNGHCELQDLVYELKIERPRFIAEPPGHALDNSNPMIYRDLNKCILCGRCVRGCNEVQVNLVIDFGYRGGKTKIVTAADRSYGDSNCVFCGECVQLCPVGALVENKARFAGRPWDIKKVATTCTYCGTGCTIDLNIIDGRVVKITGNESGVTNQGSLCVKGRFGYEFIHHKDRLTTPLIKEDGRFREATWDEALALTAKKLGQIKAEHGPDAIGALSSARCTNEENYLMQKFIRAVIGTNNIDHCARL
jgi:predicted molibdopterin-dependent oxidoreductase YjgC